MHTIRKDYPHRIRQDCLYKMRKDYLHTIRKDYPHTIRKDHPHTIRKDYPHTIRKDYPHTIRKDYLHTIRKEYLNTIRKDCLHTKGWNCILYPECLLTVRENFLEERPQMGARQPPVGTLHPEPGHGIPFSNFGTTKFHIPFNYWNLKFLCSIRKLELESATFRFSNCK